MTVRDAGRCFGISYHLYCSDLVHLGANWVVLNLVPLCNPLTQLSTPNGERSTRNWCHRIDNSSLVTLKCFQLCQRGISTGKLKIYTIDGVKYSAKNECNTMIAAPRRHKHPSSSANRPSDVGVSVNINAEFNPMAVTTIFECFSRDLITEYCQGVESSTVYTVPPSFVETLHGRSNSSLPCPPLYMHAQAIIPTFLTSNIYIGLCLSNTLTST